MNLGLRLRKAKVIYQSAKVSTKSKNRRNNITSHKVSKDLSTYKSQYQSNTTISHNATPK